MRADQSHDASNELNIRYLSTTRDTIDVKDAKKRAAFAILRKKALFGYLYYLEKRENTDTFGGRLALYGGTCEPEDTSFEDTLVREIKDELGVQISQTDLTPQHTLLTNRENKEKMLSGVWRFEPPRQPRRLFGLSHAAIGCSSIDAK